MFSEETKRIIREFTLKHRSDTYASKLDDMSKDDKGKAIEELLEELLHGNRNQRICNIKYDTYISPELLNLATEKSAQVSHYTLDNIIMKLESLYK